MSNKEKYFAVECWEDVPGQEDKPIHVRLHIGSESGLRKVWETWNHEHPDRTRYDRIISRRTDPSVAIEDIHQHMACSHP